MAGALRFNTKHQSTRLSVVALLTQTPQQSHSLSPLHEPLHWRAKRDPAAKMLMLYAVLSNEGRVVGPCWEKLKPKGPKGRFGSQRHMSAIWNRVSRSHQKTSGIGNFREISGSFAHMNNQNYHYHTYTGAS